MYHITDPPTPGGDNLREGDMPNMPIKLANGTSIGPVALICSTVAFLGMLAGFLILLVYAPDAADSYLRPLIPTVAAIGAGVALWVRVHASDKATTAQNQAIYEQASDASTAAEQATKTVSRRLDGELSEKIEQAISTALARQNGAVAGDPGVQVVGSDAPLVAYPEDQPQDVTMSAVRLGFHPPRASFRDAVANRLEIMDGRALDLRR